MKSLKLHGIMTLGALILSCAGGQTSGDNGQGGGDFLTGTFVAPDGQTPIAGATVWIPGSGPSPALYTLSSDCESPPESYKVYACTGPDGTFRLNVKGLSGVVTLKLKKGAFMQTLNVDLNSGGSDLGKVTLGQDPSTGAPKMAVVTGYYDRMQDVLAKLGFGEIYSSGRLRLGTERFDLYDGDASLDSSYPDFDALFSDGDGDSKPDINNYDIVFINCGTNYEYLLSDPSKVQILREYVQNGGRLYVTDLSYDFVEQVFPEFIDFYLSDSTPEADPESMDVAQQGSGGITTEADVKDNMMKEWLKIVSCVNTMDNPVDCIDPSTGKVHIEGFLPGWAVMNGPHTSKTSEVKIWVEGTVDFGYPLVTDIKPLTVSFPFGSGKVLFTSYHTEAAPITGLLPQERILQYLVFF